MVADEHPRHTLANKASKAAAALRDAETAQAAEQTAVKGRNRATRTAYWTDVHTQILPERIEAMRDARAAFSEAVRTAGDVGAAYGSYVAAHARWQATHNAVANGLVSYVNDLTGEPHPDPEERWGRAVYPDGVQAAANHAPDPFVKMLEAATVDARQAHLRETAAELQAALAADLEPEGDD